MFIVHCYCIVIIDSGSANRAYRMPHTSMINITFGEERREVVLRRQKQSASATPQHQPLVFQNRTSRPVANGNDKQQQQQPVYRLLQRNTESSSPGQQRAAQHSQVTRPPQQTTVSAKTMFVLLCRILVYFNYILNVYRQKGKCGSTCPIVGCM